MKKYEKKEVYDLILLHLNIPEFNGWNIFKKLKEGKLVHSKNRIIFTATKKINNEMDELIKDWQNIF